MFHRLTTGALLGATALVAFSATPAAAQRIERIVAFGDSYVDDGNAFQLAGIPFPSAYPTGRFSGGSNYVDTLSQLLTVPVDNFGIGGAKTDNTNVTVGLPGFATQYQSFLAGGGPAAFPRTTGRFGSNDLLLISIGGNDARDYQLRGGALAGAPAAATVAAANATTGLNALVNAGARNISFLAGNTAELPEVAASASAQQVRNSYSTTFNQALQTTLAGYARNGAIVHYLDLSVIGSRIRSNFAAYGLTGLACPPLPNTACITNTLLADQNLFYFDQVHLTSAGYAIVGRYVARQLQAPLTLGASSEVGLDTARQFGRTLTSRVDLGSPRDGEVLEGPRVFVTGDFFSRDIGASATNDAFDINSTGITGGVEFGMGNGLVGIAANYSQPRASFGNDSSQVRGQSYQLGAYAGYALGPVFVQAHGAYGWDRHRISRTGVIDNLSARPDGTHYSVGAKAGYLHPVGPVRVGPVVAVDYAKAKVDGYTEQGDQALALNVASQRYSALVGSAGLELRGDFAGGGVALRPFASAMLEKDLDGDSRTATWSQVTAPGIVNSFALGERDTGIYTRLTGGASAQLATGVQLDASASTTFGQDRGEELSANLGVRVGF
mgnify:CR=1 FL=1